jgi:hypothetical protein
MPDGNSVFNILLNKEKTSFLKKNIFFYFLLLFFILISSGYAQSFDPFIEHLMNETNLDSLEKNVRILSGEDSVLIGRSYSLIRHRKNPDNDMAAEFIRQKLSEYNLEVYDSQYSSSGRNIYAIQRGTLYPDKYFIYCAHYDAVDYFCADDNASGTAGVLETARILNGYMFDYSILYAFWDEEEIGLLGSKFFAEEARSGDMDIIGLINFEMSGWDSNDDGLMDIHTGPYANSVFLAELMVNIRSLYNLPLQPVVYNPGTTSSDHAAFWALDYSAICFNEAFFGEDFNPYYHTAEDRIDKFNMNYFHNIAKLGTALIAELASGVIFTGVDNPDQLPLQFSMSNYPNPFNSSTLIKYELPVEAYITMELYNVLGERIKSLFTGYKTAGIHEQYLDAGSFAGGTYIILLKTSDNLLTHKIIHLK